MIHEAKPRGGVLCRHCKKEKKEIFVKPGIVLCVGCSQNKCSSVASVQEEKSPVGEKRGLAPT